MFSKSKRFCEPVSSTPAVGHYDVSNRPFESTGGPALFAKDKRFKESAAPANGNHEASLLDTSTCSTISTKSSGSGKVFATPGKPCGKGKIKALSSSTSLTDLSRKVKSRQPPLTEDERRTLARKIDELQEEIQRLKAENKMLHKMQDIDDVELEARDELNTKIAGLMKDVERLQNENSMLNVKVSDLENTVQECQTLKSTLATLNAEIEKLRIEIEEEILRNKALLVEQNKHECSLATMQADLELANSQVTALQDQVKSLEQLNTDISESREDLENQCTKLHGMTIALQKDNLTLQEQVDEQRTLMKESNNNHINKMKTLEHELEQALDVHRKIEEGKRIILKEKDALVISVKDLKKKHEKIVNEDQQEIQQLKDRMRRNEEQSLQNLQNLTNKCEALEEQLGIMQKTRNEEVENLQRELELSKTSLHSNQEEYRTLNQTFKDLKENYDTECQNRAQLEKDYNTVKESLSKTDRELAQKQEDIAFLRETEKKQQATVEMLSTKLEECNVMISSLEKMKTESEDMIEQNNSFRDEIEHLKEQLSNVREENQSLVAEEQKTRKLKQEFGRRLMETQKKLTQKEIELKRCEEEFKEYVIKYKDQESWKKKFEDLEERIAPFQEQLDAYEFEKQALLNRNSESQSEIDKLGQQYAKLLGHQNQKQKIRHVLKLKEENSGLKKEVFRLQEETVKQKQTMKKLQEKLNKTTGVKKFDPSLAFQHSVLENKENTPLKTRGK